MKLEIPKVGIILFLIVLSLSGCWRQDDRHQLLQHYQTYHDYASLEKLSKYLKPGMPQTEAEKIVGNPDYSPAPGIFYYGSHNGRLGLILIYHKDDNAKDSSEVKTNTLHRIILGEIME